MNLKELESRVLALEKSVESLESKLQSQNGKAKALSINEIDPAKQRHWWVEDAGAFKDDPGFEEMVRLGREYRESLHPDRKKKKQQRKMKNAGS